MKCPLCNSNHTVFLAKTLHYQEREFFQCKDCKLIFVPKLFHLSSDSEKARYDLHQNNENDLSYRNYLAGLLNPLWTFLSEKEKEHLDYGCGSAQSLKFLLDQEKIKSSFYDLYFYPNEKLLQQTYDLVTCIEVIEHFNDPFEDISILISLVKKDGLLFVNTQLFKSELVFENWWYKNDPTHISIFTKETLKFLEIKFNLERIYCDEIKTIIWRKK